MFTRPVMGVNAVGSVFGLLWLVWLALWLFWAGRAKPVAKREGIETGALIPCVL